MDVKITLTPGYSPNIDNFTIYYTVRNGSPAVAASGITRLQLSTGYTISVPMTTTGGTVNSTGICTSAAGWTVNPCYYWNVVIGANDIADATGNIGALEQYNGVVLIDYTDCNGIEQKYLGNIAGTFNNAFCANESVLVGSPYYYKENQLILATESMSQDSGIQCS